MREKKTLLPTDHTLNQERTRRKLTDYGGLSQRNRLARFQKGRSADHFRLDRMRSAKLASDREIIREEREYIDGNFREFSMTYDGEFAIRQSIYLAVS